MDFVIPPGKLSAFGRFLWFSALFFFVPISISCSTSENYVESTPSGPVTLTIGIPVQTGQDPLHGATQAALLISREGLTLPNRDGRVQPRLAESWRESADGRVWTIKLRPNAFFHDGTPVDALTVKESLERSLKTSDRDLAPGLADIVAIETAGSHEVLMTLRERSTFLLDDLGVAITKQVPGSGTIGSGPFVTTSTTNSEVVMSAVSNYYRGKPTIERIVLKAYPTNRTAWAAMMRGDVDFLYEVGPEAVEFMQGESSVNVFPFLRSYFYGVIFNSKHESLAHPQVRRALNYAVDRRVIVDHALKGHGIPAPNAAWPLHWAYDANVPAFSYDPGRAAALLDNARVPRTLVSDGAGPPSRFRFSCLVPEGFALWERMALMVQRNLSEIGIDMRLESVTFETFNRRIAAGTFDAVAIEFVAGNSPTRPFTFWYSQSKRNIWGYKNPFMDVALDGIRRASSESGYKEAFRRFQTESIDNPPAIFLALGEITRAVSARFQVVAPPGSDILHTIANWRPADDAVRMTN